MNSADNDLLEVVRDALAQHSVPGASVAVLKDGKMSRAAAGLANVSTGVELTTDAVMHIGSITKVLNATLVMQLVDDGLVDLDACILAYLPKLEWADEKAAQEITVRMLLNHTSGLDGATVPDEGPDEEALEKGMQRWARLGQLFSPGAEFSYCNPGTSIAGYIVQRIRKESWFTLIRKHLFEPLQMHHATALPQDALLHRASVGHFLDPTRPGQVVRTSRAFLPLSGAPSGTTLMMSAGDLIRFTAAHLNGGVGANGARILTKRSAEAMQTVSIANKGKGYARFDMGLGWMLTPEGLLYHNGGSPGVFSSLYAHPDTGFAVAVLTNGEHGRALIDRVVSWALDGICQAVVTSTFDERDEVRPLDRPAACFTGVFEDVVVRYRVVEEEGRLCLSAQSKFEYYDSVSLEATPLAPLDYIGDGKFLWRASPEVAGGPEAWSRLFAFRGERADGSFRHIGNKMHLYTNRAR